MSSLFFVTPLRGLWVLGLCLWISPSLPANSATTGGKISFNREIQPILSENCYPCHGPDSSARKPKKHPLRLDRAQFAFEPRDDGKPVIIKGDPAGSEILRRLKSTDEDEVMPPPSEHKRIKKEEIALIAQWIAQGASYEKHWSFIPPARTRLPDEPAGWAINPIDHFVMSKLRENGLEPNPEEQASRLFRRLSFDLTGLPPSPKELEKFLKDKSAKAYEKAVDRMLSSVASAEHFTRYWLDAVRYADTQGIHHDHSRSIWPYRDWVIAAFKNNMPFDEFTIEQIAGDLLPDSTLNQKIASGYNRLLPTTGEGGAIPEEYAAIYARDRVDTTSAVWLGLTTGCATCHDHKFDPITTKDFYSLTAFFRNNTVPVLDGPNDGNTPPLLFVPRNEDRARWPALEKEIAAKKAAIEDRRQKARPEFEKWIDSGKALSLKEPSRSHLVLHLPLADSGVPAGAIAKEHRIEWSGGNEHHSGPFGSAPLLNGGKAMSGDAPGLSRNAEASYGAFLYVEDKPSGAVFSRMDKAEHYRGWDLFLSEGRPTAHIVDQFPDAALKVTAKEALEPGRWHHVMAVFDGKREGASALSLFVDGRQAVVEVNNNSLGSNIVADVPFRLGSRSDKSGTADELKDGKVFLQDLRFYNRALDSAEVARLAAAGLVREYLDQPADRRGVEQTNVIYDLFLTGFDKPSEKLQERLARLETEKDQLRKRGATTLVMQEKKDTEPVAFVLVRGNYASKSEQVKASTPAALPPTPPDAPRNRLGLARWIVSLQNPLTARVTVNRLWSYLFGTGIVETTEDFGVMGARPSNQDLLDWLAIEFMDSGWDFRHMVKTMVMSATYRQSPAITPDKLEKDPLNRLLSRGPHFRLDAEEIRDQALAASGLLVRKIGGPPTKPYQPEGVWEAVAMKVSNTRIYKQDTGEGLYRRSLYTFWKRIAPPPSMEILDAPSREVFCTRRDRNDTPLQAFVTMNDPQFVEAARKLASTAMESSRKFDVRLDRIAESLLARRLTPPERTVVRRMHDRALTNYLHYPSAAKALISVGESKPDDKLPPANLAAWTLVCSQVMNLDESLTK